MADYQIPLPVSSPFMSIGDDVYAKSLTPWVPETWITGMVLGEPVVGQETWNLEAGANGLNTVKAYLVFANQAFRIFTADEGANVFTSAAHDLVQGTRVYFRGTNLPAGITAGQAYWVDSVTTDTFQVKSVEDLSGSVVDISTAGTGVMQFVATSYRSSSDIVIGNIAALEIEQKGEGESAAAIIAAFKADAVLGTESGGMVTNAATAATQATAAALDASKIPRLLNPIAAGASAIETWIVTVDSRGTLISTKAYS